MQYIRCLMWIQYTSNSCFKKSQPTWIIMYLTIYTSWKQLKIKQCLELNIALWSSFSTLLIRLLLQLEASNIHHTSSLQSEWIPCISMILIWSNNCNRRHKNYLRLVLMIIWLARPILAQNFTYRKSQKTTCSQICRQLYLRINRRKMTIRHINSNNS